jgi:hypothetical protein
MAKERLIAHLKLLRLEAGNPSLSDLAKRSHGKFSKATIDDHLSGRRAGLPNWRLLSAYVTACHEAAESTGLSIENLGTIVAWRAYWAAAHNGDCTANSPLVTPSPEESKEDPTYAMSETQVRRIREFQSPPLELANHLAERTADCSTTASITPVLARLEEDLAKLGGSLPGNVGLLVITSGPDVGKRFAVEKNLVTIGRDPGSDICLDDVTISRRHAVIHRGGGKFTARDIGSRNGTYLHQKLISKETPLNSYDELHVGAFRLLFVQGRE